MSDETTLLPCPFCGGEAHISASSDGYGVECWNRRCIDMQMEEIPTEAEAIEAWNTRAERTCKRVLYKPTGVLVCSECGAGMPKQLDKYCYLHYCPNCGSKVVNS